MTWTYPAWVLAGVVAGALVRRVVPAGDHPHRGALTLVAMVGALGGALAFEVPADVFGWTVDPSGAPSLGRLGGRTVLGGILGGWIAVEAAKPALGIRVPTGDAFAAPLATALAFGRLGCWSTGCCAGRACESGWLCDARGAGVWPVQPIEALFHGAAAATLVVLARRGVFPGRLLAGYVALYSLVRFGLEYLRSNPPVAAGLTYYQLLCLPLLVLGLVVIARRRRRATGAIEHDLARDGR